MTSTVVMAPVLCLRTEAVSAISRDGGRRSPSEAYIQAASGLYEPSIRANHFAPVSGSQMGRLMPWPFTSRMTVVQLASGDLFLHSPIVFDVPLQRIFRRWAGSATSFPPTGHYAHIGEWARAFRVRSQRIDVQFHRDLDRLARVTLRQNLLGPALNSPCTSVTNRRRVRLCLQRALGLELTDWRGYHACIAL
jgi:hypothetical protein